MWHILRRACINLQYNTLGCGAPAWNVVIKEKEREEMYEDNFVVLHFQQSTCICNPLSSMSKFGKHRDIKIIFLIYKFEIIQHEPYI